MWGLGETCKGQSDNLRWVRGYKRHFIIDKNDSRTSLTNILVSKALQCRIVYATNINYPLSYMYNHIWLYNIILQTIDKIPFKVVMIDNHLW